MQRLLLAGALALLPMTLPAQGRESPTRADTVLDELSLPREVASEVVDLFNAPATLRVNGRLDVVAEREVAGDIAVLNGPLMIAGHVTGRVVAVNADVTLKPTARIDGDLLVVGGVVEGRGAGYVGGEIRIYRQLLQYREDGDRIVAERGGEDDRWWSRRRARRTRTWSDIRFASARTYNRVEGLPVHLGPTLRQDVGWGRFALDAYGVIRTADNFRWDSENLGHNVRAELRTAGLPGVAVGGRLFDVVEGVEDWQLTDPEVGLASFFLHRDFRDYYNRHGGSGYLSLLAGRDVDLTFALSDERWGARRVRDPFTLFRNRQEWRVNPAMDEGRFHVGTATLRVDTRNDVDDPWAGWYLVADYERGTGRVTRAGPRIDQTLVDPAPGAIPAGTGPVTYGRGFLDLRRYNRIAPNAQFNLRLVLGGWLHGDQLPLQRRFSVGGPGTLPGFDFREVGRGVDVNQCTLGSRLAPPGRPALCDRMALAQAEYRGDLRFDFGGFDDDDVGIRLGAHSDAVWVVFADAGRGWLVGPRQGTLQYGRGQLPAPGTFRTDVGLGLDFDILGLYVAKAVSDSKEPANFFVRVQRRF